MSFTVFVDDIGVELVYLIELLYTLPDVFPVVGPHH